MIWETVKRLFTAGRAFGLGLGLLMAAFGLLAEGPHDDVHVITVTNTLASPKIVRLEHGGYVSDKMLYPGEEWILELGANRSDHYTLSLLKTPQASQKLSHNIALQRHTTYFIGEEGFSVEDRRCWF